MQPESAPLFRLINDAHSPAGDFLFGLVSGLGDGLIVALLCSLLMLFRLRLGMAALAAYLLSGLVAQLLKRLFDMPRPPAVLENVHLLGQAFTAHSFPSGHATSDGVVVMAALFLWGWRDWRGLGIAALFILAAIGRVYGGVHFPIDVAAGLGIGMLSMWLCRGWMAGLPVEQWQTSDWSWKIPGLIVMVEAAVLGLGYRVQPSTAQPLALVMPLAALMILLQVWKGKLVREQ